MKRNKNRLKLWYLKERQKADHEIIIIEYKSGRAEMGQGQTIRDNCLSHLEMAEGRAVGPNALFGM